jgi:3-oxoacyl-[acyl-carrier protein] reductase
MSKVFISGAFGSLGFALSKKYLENNFNAYLHCRTKSSYNHKKESLKKYKNNYKIIAGDLRDNFTVDKISKNLIDNKIDIIINNAGIYLQKEFDKTSLKEIRKIFEVNFFFIVKLLLKITKSAKKRNYLIVNINSLSGLNGSRGESVYSASKHALKGLFDSLDLDELSKKISILNIYPGAIQSKITRKRETFKKLMLPEEVAEVVFAQTKKFQSLKIKSLILTRKVY